MLVKKSDEGKSKVTNSWHNKMFLTAKRILTGAFGLAMLCGAAAVHANITDNFQRADGDAIGNGWIEKTPSAWSLQGGAAVKSGAGYGYLDNLVYRPASEDVADVEASVEFRITDPSAGYPQIMVRILSSSVTYVNWLDAYMIYFDGNPSGAVLGRQRGSAFVQTLAEIPVSPALNTTDTYRMRLRATGTNPVVLNAWIERLSGGNWVVIGQATVNDNSPDRITGAGSVGFSGYIETSYRFDNFVRTNIVSPPPPPPPAELSSISPVSIPVGSGSTQVTINGSGFTPSSVARWNGSPRTTQFISATQVRMTLTSADLANERIGAVTVATGSTITAPMPLFVRQASETVFFDHFNRGPAANIGNGWIEKMPSVFEILASGVLWADWSEPYEFHDTITYRPLNEAQLDVETGVEFVRSAGARFPQVHARIQGDTVEWENLLESYILYVEDGLAPQGLAIAVQPPVYAMGECIIGYAQFPTLPAVGTRYRLRLQVRGSYPVQLTGIMEVYNPSTQSWSTFVQASVVHDNNTTDPGIYCPYPSVPAPITTAGSVGVAKWYDRTDGYDNFYWKALAPSNMPTLSSIAPMSAVAGSGSFTLTVSGTNFNSNSVVRWNGSNRPTTLISSTQLQATISASDIASAGTRTVTVYNSGAGGGTTAQSATFTITPPPTVVFTDNFNRANSATVGNGWIEKTPAAFSIENNMLRKNAFDTDYLNSVVYRPASEAQLNMEVQAELRINNLLTGWPQIFARLQSATAGTMNTLDGYIWYLDGHPQRAILGRQRGSVFLTELSVIELTEPVNLTDTYRLRLRVSGTTTVQLDAWVERLSGSNWVVIGQTSAIDNTPQRISTSGVAGIGSYIEDFYSYDNVRVLRLNN